MIWRNHTRGLETYPGRVEVRACSIGEWRGLEKLPEAERPDALLRLCCRIDGQTPVAEALDIHAHGIIVAAIMENPWNGPPLTDSNDC